MKKFEEIVTQELKIPVEKISDSLTPKDVRDWDSMKYLIFISELEENFKVSFSMDEVLAASSLGDVRKLLREKGANV